MEKPQKVVLKFGFWYGAIYQKKSNLTPVRLGLVQAHLAKGGKNRKKGGKTLLKGGKILTTFIAFLQRG